MRSKLTYFSLRVWCFSVCPSEFAHHTRTTRRGHASWRRGKLIDKFVETVTDDMRKIGLHHQGVGLCAMHVAAVQTLPKTGVRRFNAPHRTIFGNSVFGPHRVPDGADGRSGAVKKLPNQELHSGHVQRIRSQVRRG